jgi:cytochrome c
MDSLEFNKIFGAILTAGIAFVGLGIVSDDLVHPEKLAKSVLDIKIAGPSAAPAAPAAPAVPPIMALLVNATPDQGQALTKKICIACHNFTPNGANKVGPDLYGVVGRERASYPGYTYSAALKGKPGKWTYQTLNDWLYKPSAFAPGTKMAYAGVSSDEVRASLIDYLRTLSPSPEPLPTAAEAKADDAAATKAVAAPAASTAGAPEEAALPPIGPLLAKADPEAGHAYTKKICIACHNFAPDAGNKVGPNLYGVVGRERASYPGYTYSAALKGHPGKWTFATLNEWLHKPSAFAPGTKMAYAGIGNDQTRADVIDYLRTLSPNPEPLPQAAGSPASPGAPVPQAPNTAPASPQATPSPAPAGAAPH